MHYAHELENHYVFSSYFEVVIESSKFSSEIWKISAVKLCHNLTKHSYEQEF